MNKRGSKIYEGHYTLDNRTDVNRFLGEENQLSSYELMKCEFVFVAANWLCSSRFASSRCALLHRYVQCVLTRVICTYALHMHPIRMTTLSIFFVGCDMVDISSHFTELLGKCSGIYFTAGDFYDATPCSLIPHDEYVFAKSRIHWAQARLYTSVFHRENCVFFIEIFLTTT